MVQGMTLDGLLADCGDILDSPGVKDMLAAYVSLSRVTTADGLLLLRTFPKALFSKGAPPGPTCLMRLLRSRLAHTGEQDHDYEAAVTEFKRMKEQTKATVRDHRVTWTCSLCDGRYP